jgi:hypothetical protein
MAQITIDIPDDLAQQLAPFQSQFSDLFTRLIATPLLGQQLSPQSPSIPNSLTYQEILDFLISRPTSEQIINFKVSEISQTRLQSLLQKNREAILSPEETAELDLYEQLDTLIGFLKVRAYTTLNPVPHN